MYLYRYIFIDIHIYRCVYICVRVCMNFLCLYSKMSISNSFKKAFFLKTSYISVVLKPSLSLYIYT